jgi:hypothetical protein
MGNFMKYYILLDVDKTLMTPVEDYLEEATQIIQKYQNSKIVSYRDDEIMMINTALIQAVKNICDREEDVQVILFTKMDQSDLYISPTDFTELCFSRRQLLQEMSVMGVHVSDVIMTHDGDRDLFKQRSTWHTFFDSFHQDMHHARNMLALDKTELQNLQKLLDDSITKKFKGIEIQEEYTLTKHEKNKQYLMELIEEYPDKFLDLSVDEELSLKYSMMMSFCQYEKDKGNSSISVWFADDKESDVQGVSLAAKAFELDNPEFSIALDTHKVVLFPETNDALNLMSNNTVEAYEQSIVNHFRLKPEACRVTCKPS